MTGPSKNFDSVNTEQASIKRKERTYWISQWADSGSGTTSDPYVDGYQDIINDASNRGYSAIEIRLDGHTEVDSDAPITHSSVGVRVVGEIGQARIYLADSVNSDLWHMESGLGLVELDIQGNKANQSQTSHGIVVKAEATNQQWHDIQLTDFNGDNLRFEARGYAWQLNEVYCEKAADNNIHVVGPNGKLSESKFNGGYIFAATNEGLLVDSDAQLLECKFQGVIFNANGGHGVYIQNGKDNDWIGCDFTENTGDGFKSGQLQQFVSCTAESNDGAGFNGTASEFVGCKSVSNNQGTAGATDGIKAGQNSELSACKVVGTSHSKAYVLNSGTVADESCVDVDDLGRFYAADDAAFGGRMESPPIENLGGSSGSLAPPKLDVEKYIVKVDAGGSAVNVPAIDNIDQEGRRCVVVRTGGENVTLQHNTAGTGSILIHDGSVDITLSSSGDMVVYEYVDGSWREVGRMIQ